MEVNLPGMLTVFMGGLASFFSPCVIPLVPAYVSYITGVKINDLEKERYNRGLGFTRGLGFVSGFALIFIVMGAAASFLGQLLFANRELLARIGGVVVFTAGLHLAGLLPLKSLYREKRPAFFPRRTGFLASAVLGAAFAFGWTPCVGPILAGVLVYAASAETVSSGVFLLGVYSLGLAVPLLAAAAALDRLIVPLQKAGPYLRYVSTASGLVLAVLGLFLFFDRLAVLTF